MTVYNSWILALINLSDEDFKYLVAEFGSENLSTWTVLKGLRKKNCLLENIFLVQQKKKKN